VDASRLADRARLRRRELLADFVRESLQRRVIEIVGERETFVAPIRGNVGGLAIEIDRVLGIDLELLGDRRRNRAEPRPDARDVGERNVRIREEFERAAPLAVAIEREPVPHGLGWRQRYRAGEVARRIERIHLRAMTLRPRGADAAE